MHLPVISGGELIRLLHKRGFVIRRQKGSHVVVKHADGRQTTVPLHSELDRGTLTAILTQIGELEHFLDKRGR